MKTGKDVHLIYMKNKDKVGLIRSKDTILELGWYKKDAIRKHIHWLKKHGSKTEESKTNGTKHYGIIKNIVTYWSNGS